MAKKDISVTEDKVLKPPQEENSTIGEDSIDDASSTIKNAHATGDGSYGRSDESIPDETSEKNSDKENSY